MLVVAQIIFLVVSVVHNQFAIDENPTNVDLGVVEGVEGVEWRKWREWGGGVRVGVGEGEGVRNEIKMKLNLKSKAQNTYICHAEVVVARLAVGRLKVTREDVGEVGLLPIEKGKNNGRLGQLMVRS